eukprot:CAMPEP_0119309358 /NCGR_PEP_ID=MMETSP1333-20130426/15128_1 /TAXON_ID=418940 /ORGANISM="Scyphosphaera apsteinii, Strain RCC1455" /LENGTH=225 /DNA_ID=CAMNT_0007313315 /DNA_START=33 /DNA_END=710 /DNA_ORIENTATION=+
MTCLVFTVMCLTALEEATRECTLQDISAPTPSNGKPARFSIAGCKKLQVRSLPEDSIIGLANAIMAYPKLEDLEVSGSAINDTSVEILLDSLRLNNVIHSLALHNNQIRDDGAATIARFVNASRTVDRLQVRQNLISAEGAKFLASAYTMLKVFNGIDLATLRQKSSLHLADIGGITVVEATMLHELLHDVNAHQIESLDLGMYTMNNAVMKALGMNMDMAHDEL